METLQVFTIALSMQKGLGSVQIKALFDQASIDNIFDLKVSTLNERLKVLIQRSKKQSIEMQRKFLNLKKHNIYIKCLWEEDYPYLLKQIPDPPPVIFYRGNYSVINNRLLAIVGTRKNSDYGKRVVEELVVHLKDYPVSTVSGMAFGTDTAAHLSSIKSQVKTLAVLPGQVNVPMPMSNDYIYKKILDNSGLILSEFCPINAPSSDSSKFLFPRRNRIIAGISDYTVVVEAGDKSGAIITGEIASDYDRRVFAVPSSIYSNVSKGSHRLIFENVADIYTGPEVVLEALNLKSLNKFNNRSSNLTGTKRQIHDKLLAEPCSIDELAKICKIPLNTVTVLCGEMELEGLIKRNLNGKYSL